MTDTAARDVYEGSVRRLGLVPAYGANDGSVPLTSLSHGAGSGGKLSAAELFPLVRDLDIVHDPRLLVGSATGDDAAVFAVRSDLALVQTVDFLTPIVDYPYDFGRIAAANALSDVYAMGGQPLTALNLVAFPLQRLGADVLRKILAGGLAMAHEAGCVIVGGHSVDDPEPKYGLAVTGTIDPARILTNAGARAGDVLVLTKPVGVGALTTAYKRQAASESDLAAAIETMVTLNARASRQALAAGASAATDVTGFGLLGHLHNLARESGLAAEVRASSVPALPGALQALDDGSGISGASHRNLAYCEEFTAFADAIPHAHRRLLCDPSTSGGLLVAVAAERAGAIDGTVIGRIVAADPGTIVVV